VRGFYDVPLYTVVPLEVLKHAITILTDVFVKATAFVWGQDSILTNMMSTIALALRLKAKVVKPMARQSTIFPPKKFLELRQIVLGVIVPETTHMPEGGIREKRVLAIHPGSPARIDQLLGIVTVVRIEIPAKSILSRLRRHLDHHVNVHGPEIHEELHAKRQLHFHSLKRKVSHTRIGEGALIDEARFDQTVMVLKRVPSFLQDRQPVPRHLAIFRLDDKLVL
jgi:hypothetical protein